MNEKGFLYYRNQKARARWMYRWAQQGGSFFHRARSLQDLRDSAQRWNGYQLLVAADNVRDLAKKLHKAAREKREIEKEVPHQVVNLALARIERARRQATARQRTGVRA